MHNCTWYVSSLGRTLKLVGYEFKLKVQDKSPPKSLRLKHFVFYFLQDFCRNAILKKKKNATALRNVFTRY